MKQNDELINLSEDELKSVDYSRTQLNEQLSTMGKYFTIELAKGKPYRLQFFELFMLKYAGWKDGKAGLPKQTEAGDWTSARLRKELDAYEEYCDVAWGKLQVDLRWAYMACDSFIDEILRLKERCAYEKPPELPTDTPAYHIRKRGEEALSETQVFARRKREAEARLASKRREFSHTQQAIRECYEELSLLHSFILEANHAVSLVCERVMNHTRQRIDVYWRAAYRVHPEKERLPAPYAPLRLSNAEAIYREHHTGTESAIEKLLTSNEQAQAEKTEEMMEVAV